MSTSSRSNVYPHVTNAIIQMIDTAPAVWRMPWHHAGVDVARPTNISSGNAYRGINTVSLWAAASAHGYSSGVWGTYRQWQALGLQVHTREQSSIGVFWKQTSTCARGNHDDSDPDTGGHQRHFARSFSLFNAEQVEGYEHEPAAILPESERLASAENFIAQLGIDTVFGSPNAYYHVVEDRTHMPDFNTFDDAPAFYATHIHECAHASGAGHRLDRNFSAKFTQHALAMEEATAELTAAFLLADLGIAHEPRPDHAAYIASWLQLFNTDNRAIFIAASKAQTAADWMHAQQVKRCERSTRAAPDSAINQNAPH